MARDGQTTSEDTPESTLFVYVALAVDLAVAVSKLIVGLLAGSTAMLAEAAHSFADTTNQVFLLVGIKLSDRPADEEHPYGHGKDRVFWAFLAAIFIFVSGAFFSLYEGIQRLFHGEAHEGAFWPGYLVLGLSLLFDLGSLAVSWREANRRATRLNLNLIRFLRNEPALTLKTTFYSDIAAVLGIVIAAAGLFLQQMTGNSVFDGVASVLIGIILVLVALILGANARDLILGSAASPATRQAIRGAIEACPDVIMIIDLLTMRLGLASVLVTGKIEIKDGLTTDDIERLMQRLATTIHAAAPNVKNVYLEPRAASAGAAGA